MRPQDYIEQVFRELYADPKAGQASDLERAAYLPELQDSDIPRGRGGILTNYDSWHISPESRPDDILNDVDKQLYGSYTGTFARKEEMKPEDLIRQLLERTSK